MHDHPPVRYYAEGTRDKRVKQKDLSLASWMLTFAGIIEPGNVYEDKVRFRQFRNFFNQLKDGNPLDAETRPQ